MSNSSSGATVVVIMILVVTRRCAQVPNEDAEIGAITASSRLLAGKCWSLF